MSDKQTSSIQGTTLTPPGPGAWIGKEWRRRICGILNSYLNRKFYCIVSAADGSPPVIVNAEITTFDGSDVTKLDLSGVLSGGGGGATLPETFLVKDDLGSCLKCNAWDGTNEGAVTYVAKKHSIRILNTGDVQSGVTYTYAFAQGAADSTSLSGDVVTALLGGVGDGSGTPNIIGNDVAAMHYWTRTETGSDGSTENDVITPPFLFNCIIYAVPIAPETLDGKTCSWLEKTGREWGIKNS